MDGRWIGALALSIPALAPIMLLNYDGSLLWAVVVAAIVGFGVGAEIDVLAFLSARYFGLLNYGALWGTIVGLIGLGTGTGPLIASLIFDYTESYDLLFYSLVPCLLIVGLLLISLPGKPEFLPLDQAGSG
jgi:MFS family permease